MTYCFFFCAEQWHELPNFPNPNKWGYSMVSLNNDVYVTGMLIHIPLVKIQSETKRGKEFLSLHALFERAAFAGN